MYIVRNSFIQMSKITNVKGRINYISSHARQENLYAVYETTDRQFWNELAKCNQEEFRKSGTDGKCIEAREFIIALPKSFVEYEPSMFLQEITRYFKDTFDTECIAALHHNKKKTNYHIHLIFSERRLLEEPIVKVATRNMFYDEQGKHVRTKKEILGEDGEIRKRCKIIPKGEIYERKIFSKKNPIFKQEHFIEDVKKKVTIYINCLVKDETELLQVFERESVYLPTKKIGKNNPREDTIRIENDFRKEWNYTVDRALLSGVTENEIKEVRLNNISVKAKELIQKVGYQEGVLVAIIRIAISRLEELIKIYMGRKMNIRTPIDKNNVTVLVTKEQELQPQASQLAQAYRGLSDKHKILDEQNRQIFKKEQRRYKLEIELDECKGLLKWKKRDDLQKKIADLEIQIKDMKKILSNTVISWGYENMNKFITVYIESQREYVDYQRRMKEWKNSKEQKIEPKSIKEKLAIYKEEVSKQTQENNITSTRSGRGR